SIDVELGASPVYCMIRSVFQNSGKLLCLDNASIVDANDNGQLENGAYNSWVVSTVTQVEEVKMLNKQLS
ncbi:hypothetical protein C5167_041685, partial [Papaver somniferum]